MLRQLKQAEVPALAILLAAVLFLSWRTREVSLANDDLTRTLSDLEVGASQSRDAAGQWVGRRLRPISIEALNGEGRLELPPVGLDGTDYYLLILFTPLDCASCLLDLPGWKNLTSAVPPNVTVAGVVAGPSRETVQQFIEDERPGIPLFYDEKGELFSSLGVYLNGRTPLKVFARRDGTILYARRVDFSDLRNGGDILNRIALLMDLPPVPK